MTDPTRALLDTNVVIGLFAGEPVVIKHVEACAQVFLPVVVVGELFYGAMRSTRRKDNLARLEEFTKRVAILACVPETARAYGRIKAALSVKGRPIPDNDLWIAAIAVQHNLTLLTRDTHFTGVEGMAVDMLA